MIQSRKARIFLGMAMFILISYSSISSFISYYPLKVDVQNNTDAQPRIYCLISTSPKYFQTRARAVHETWAPRCDKYHFISEESNDTNGLPIAPIPNITAGYEHLTQKSTLSFLYAYEHVFDDADWFVKADDDTYLFVENLKAFLKEQNTSLPITFGFNFKTKVPNGFHTGGASYVLSRESLKRFYQAHQEPNTTCAKDLGAEDVEIASCLRKHGVSPGKSLDEHNRERFHHLTFTDHYRGRFANWFLDQVENKPLTGPDCCSDSTISFHYVPPDEQYLIEKVRYGIRRAK